jgi:sulfite reductase (NADPH) hemoprotein beta-component
MADPTPVEGIKARSNGLRGTLKDSLADAHTGGLREDDQQLIRLHGSYQQDDRDQREERRQQRLEPAYSFMIRTRLPGGRCTPAQWLAMDELARRYANGSLRLTTRQAFQLHGVLKRDLKTTIAAMNAVLVDTLAACGDVNRNVVSASHAGHGGVQDEVLGWSQRLSEHLLPKTRAYHEIWLDGEIVAGGGPDPEPVLGHTYLPRKFKSGIALPPINDVDIFSNDLGFIAIVEEGVLVGFNLAVGGGLGMTHGEPATYPRLATVIGFLPPERLLEVATAVVTVQRDFGDRTNRRHARLKYTIDDHGIEWFRTEVERRSGFTLDEARPYAFTSVGDRFGWQESQPGRWSVTLRLPAGRIADRDGEPRLSGLRQIASWHPGHFRITPNQNLVIADVPTEAKERLAAELRQSGLDLHDTATPLRLDALACVALPTCPLAMAEAERWLPTMLDLVEETMARHGVRGEPLLIRVTGCPNGCARPQLAEIAFIGKAPGRYNLYLGGGERGERLNVLYRENLDGAGIAATLDALIGEWARERSPGERFGDFARRKGLVSTAD